MVYTLILLSCLALMPFANPLNKTSENFDLSNNTETFTAMGNSEGSSRLILSTLLPSTSFIQNIQNNMIGYWKDYMNLDVNIEELANLAQTQHDEFLKRINQLNDTVHGRRLCELINFCANSISSTEIHNSLEKDENTFDENESSVAHERRGEVSEESSSSEEDILIGKYGERREPRQIPITSLFGPSISILQFLTIVPIALANVAMTLVVLSFNISFLADGPRLIELQQQKLNALAAIGGVPPEIVNPVPEDPARKEQDKLDDVSFDHSNNIHRQGRPSYVPTAVLSLSEKLDELVNNSQNFSVTTVVLAVVSWVLIYFILQSFRGYLSPGISFLILIALADAYLYYRSHSNNRTFSPFNKRSVEVSSRKLEETASFVENALIRLSYLDNQP